MFELLTKIRENKNKLQKLLSVKENADTFYNWLETELTYNSNAVSGNNLTRKDTEFVIKKHITNSSKPIKDYLEAINHAKAFEFILNFIQNDTEITEDTIKQINKTILSGIDNDNAGIYRQPACVMRLPIPERLPYLMKDFVDWLNTTQEDVELKAIKAHSKLISIYPFVDGNARTSRLLMNLLLLKEGYPPVIIRPIDRKRYLSVLKTLQILEPIEVAENYEPYIKLMLSALNRSLKTAINLFDTEKEDVNRKELLTISKFAKLCNLPVSTIRYQVKTNKLIPALYTENGYMLFNKKQKIKM